MGAAVHHVLHIALVVADKECEAAAPLSPEGLKQICEFLGYNQETQTTKELAVVAFVYLYTRIKRLDE